MTPARIPDDPSKAQIDSALADEGKRILQLIHPSARVYAMCIEGKQLSSESTYSVTGGLSSTSTSASQVTGTNILKATGKVSGK